MHYINLQLPLVDMGKPTPVKWPEIFDTLVTDHLEQFTRYLTSMLFACEGYSAGIDLPQSEWMHPQHVVMSVIHKRITQEERQRRLLALAPLMNIHAPEYIEQHIRFCNNWGIDPDVLMQKIQLGDKYAYLANLHNSPHLESLPAELIPEILTGNITVYNTRKCVFRTPT